MKKLFGGVVAAALALLAAACSPPVQKKSVPIFFPPAPALPRIEYLTSFSGLRDIQSQSAFNRFVVGEQPDLKVDKPYGVAIYDGKIYVCDTNSTVDVFDLRAHRFYALKGAVGPGQLSQPINISVTSDGVKYVADPVRGQVVAFDRNDDYLNAYGEPGGWRPVAAVAFEGRLYVADIANGLVKVFDVKSGEIVKTIGNMGSPSQRLDLPTNLAFDNEGYLYVTDVGRFQVVKFDRDGHFKTAFGAPGDSVGHFARPKGIALDREGRLYAVDASFANVQIFNKEGRILMFFGRGGEKPGDFILPAGIAIDYDNLKYFEKYAQPDFQMKYLILVTSQFGDHRVNIFGYGQEKGKHYPTDAELEQLIRERRQKELGKQPPK